MTTANDNKARVEALRGALQGRWDETRSRRVLAAALSQAKRTRTARRVAFAGAVTGLLGCVAWTVVQREHASSIVQAPSRDEAAQRLVWFEDGSRATLLAADTSLLVPQQNQRAQQVELKQGSARFDVVPRRSRPFRVLAGPATIEVLGTSFVVERLGARTRVAVVEGRVRVTDGRDTIVLGATDSMTFPRSEPAPVSSDDATAVVDEQTGRASRHPPEAAPPAAAEAAPLHTAPGVRARVATPTPKNPRSRSRDGEKADATADALFAADAARLRGDHDDAARRLDRFLNEHAADPRAGAAAFTLGRIHMDDRRAPKEAAIAFERAIRLGTGRVLESDALARAALAWQQAGNMARAVARANDYLAKAPHGDHAAAMRALVGGGQVPSGQAK